MIGKLLNYLTQDVSRAEFQNLLDRVKTLEERDQPKKQLIEDIQEQLKQLNKIQTLTIKATERLLAACLETIEQLFEHEIYISQDHRDNLTDSIEDFEQRTYN